MLPESLIAVAGKTIKIHAVIDGKKEIRIL